MKSIEYNLLFGHGNEQFNYNENIHARSASRILAYLVFNWAVDFTEITEASIQEEFDKLIKFKFNNTAFSGITEPNAFGQKRLDYLIKHGQTNEHLVYYEFKTVIKPNENSITERMVFPDLIKLALKKHDHKNCHSYFMLAGKKNIFKDTIENGNVRLPNKFKDKYNRDKIVLTIADLHNVLEHDDFNNHFSELQKRGIKKISISPSRWKHLDGMSVLFFKLNKNIYK